MRTLPSYVIMLDDGKQRPELPDSVFNRLAGRVIFRVNKTDLNTQSPLIRELTENVLPMANDHSWTLAGIDVR